MAYLAAFSPGLGPVPWAVNAELFPLPVRGLAMGLAATSNWVANAVVAQTFLTLTQLLGGSGKRTKGGWLGAQRGLGCPGVEV